MLVLVFSLRTFGRVGQQPACVRLEIHPSNGSHDREAETPGWWCRLSRLSDFVLAFGYLIIDVIYAFDSFLSPSRSSFHESRENSCSGKLIHDCGLDASLVLSRPAVLQMTSVK